MLFQCYNELLSSQTVRRLRVITHLQSVKEEKNSVHGFGGRDSLVSYTPAVVSVRVPNTLYPRGEKSSTEERDA